MHESFKKKKKDGFSQCKRKLEKSFVLINFSFLLFFLNFFYLSRVVRFRWHHSELLISKYIICKQQSMSWSRSSVGQSVGLMSRRSRVRAPPGPFRFSFVFWTYVAHYSRVCMRLAHFFTQPIAHCPACEPPFIFASDSNTLQLEKR